MVELAKELMQLSFNVPVPLGGVDPVAKSVGSSFLSWTLFPSFYSLQQVIPHVLYSLVNKNKHVLLSTS